MFDKILLQSNTEVAFIAPDNYLLGPLYGSLEDKQKWCELSHFEVSCTNCIDPTLLKYSALHIRAKVL